VGHWVRGVDLKPPEFARRRPTTLASSICASRRTAARPSRCRRGGPTKSTSLPPTMGRHGIHPQRGVRDNAEQRADQNPHGWARQPMRACRATFFWSSVCVYREHDARRTGDGRNRGVSRDARQRVRCGKSCTPSAMTMAYGLRHGMGVRIARFQNCYEPEGTWRGGREKAPAGFAARSRKG